MYGAMNQLRIVLVASVAALSGCASGQVSVSNYQSASCEDLNLAIGGNSKEISATGINRGKVESLSLPPWVPGGEKARSVIKGRQTAKIEKLQIAQSAMRSAREQRCG